MRTENYGGEKVAPANSIAAAIANWPFEQKMQPVIYKKKSVRGPNFGFPRARRVPRMGAGRSKREREIFSPSASAEPIFSFHILLGVFEINQPMSTNLSNCL